MGEGGTIRAVHARVVVQDSGSVSNWNELLACRHGAALRVD